MKVNDSLWRCLKLWQITYGFFELALAAPRSLARDAQIEVEPLIGLKSRAVRGQERPDHVDIIGQPRLDQTGEMNCRVVKGQKYHFALGAFDFSIQKSIRSSASIAPSNTLQQTWS
ncbi:hypothetical protein [Caballeronia sp. LZ035]|uniref:hypothetical protein n=1 Tax=Caballeronia sp. LZ035 TaxID=3038568 RepID=UPI0028676147|nr:hypothetical protein [Caballeronia sp. LZ035]MDR5755994.1 hypothetical protein [Caballeronia sp. LZ035]